MTSDRARASATAPQNVRFAGVLVGVQGVAGVVMALLLAVRAFGTRGPSVSFGLAEAGFFLLMGAAVLAVGVGLVRGRRGVRTPAIVVQLLLLPVVYSLIGPSRQLLLGILAGVLVIVTFLLLISEQSRRWSMGEDYPPES